MRGRSRLAILLALLSCTTACGTENLSDGAVVWCKAHLAAVASSASSLDLPTPSGFNSWLEWGDVAVAAGGMNIDGWSSLLVASDLPNRDRACIAAYTSR